MNKRMGDSMQPDFDHMNNMNMEESDNIEGDYDNIDEDEFLGILEGKIFSSYLF